MNNTPEIRFNFDKKWTVDTVSSCAETYQGFPFDSKKYTKKGKYNVLTISNVGGDRYVRFVQESNKVDVLPAGISEYQILKDNDILISMTGNVGRVSLNKGKNNLLNQRVDVLQEFDNCDKEFLFQRLSSKDFENAMILNGQGAAQKNISNTDIKNYILCYPEIPEQKQIASFLSNADFLIDSKKKELEKTKQYKATMLYKMFPQDGKLVPEIRFKGFDGDWNCSMFDKSFIKLNNNSFSRDQLNYRTGEFKNIHYGDILINFSFIVKYENKIVPFLNNNQKVRVKETDYLKTGDIVFADTAEDTTAGKMVEILNPNNGKLISGMHTYACRPLLKFETGYLGIYMNTIQFHSQLLPYMQGTKVTSFNYDYLGRTKVKYPKFEEQKRIINFFTNLDSMISNQENEIEILEHMKATLLSKMFA